MIKAQNMISSKGNAVANQIVLVETRESGALVREMFQSYDSLIVNVWYTSTGKQIELDEVYWDYSKTTGKYRNEFLGETIAETRAKIKSGEYLLTNLN